MKFGTTKYLGICFLLLFAAGCTTYYRISDQATAELMSRFYQAALQNKQSPAAALRAAQLALWRQKRWDAPYYWAAFTLQGEYR